MSNELQSKSSVFIKIVSERYSRLLSIFSMILTRVSLSVIYEGGKEDSAQLIQYLNHNYRTGLKNLENYVWICAPLSDLDQAAVLR